MERIYGWLSKAPFLHRFLLTAFVSGCMVGYYYMNVYAVVKEDIEKSRKRVEQDEYAIASVQRSIENAKKEQAEMEAMEQKSTELTKRIPVSVDLSELVGELDQMADDVRIVSIIPEEDDTQSFDSVVVRPIRIIVEGRFHSLCRFLYKMFQMNRLMDVGDVTMESRTSPAGSAGAAKSLLVAQFTARIYYSPSFVPVKAPNALQSPGAGNPGAAAMGPDAPMGP